MPFVCFVLFIYFWRVGRSHLDRIYKGDKTVRRCNLSFNFPFQHFSSNLCGSYPWGYELLSPAKLTFNQYAFDLFPWPRPAEIYFVFPLLLTRNKHAVQVVHTRAITILTIMSVALELQTEGLRIHLGKQCPEPCLYNCWPALLMCVCSCVSLSLL